ncbi:MAG TPA: M55 family metallopeptidase [Bryobacteraceae bacterium]|nr:M55 family metallopeptidase [Bryobacteraceae bacterium]HPT27065.1 M55 family metallopeptidase [Bryobacteraceae bacterium]
MRLLLLGLIACAAIAQQKNAVLIITDAEGVAGVCRQSQVEQGNQEMQRLLTGEINAAVNGFRRAGAQEVVVWDGHGGSYTLSALTIHDKARLIIGSLGPKMLLDTGRFAAVAFIGQHAKASTSRAVMAHSYSSLGIQKLTMNGKEVGEIETRAALAGAFDVPVIFLSGDRAAAEDLLAIVPQAEVAVVKDGLSYYACDSMSAVSAQQLIEAKAEAAWKKLPQVKPYKVAGPVAIETELTTRNTPAPESDLRQGVERVGPRTLRYKGKDFLEAWTLWSSR